MSQDVSDFIAQLRKRLPAGTAVEPDKSADPAGPYFIDIDDSDLHITVQWTAKHGFGFYALWKPAYGERPMNFIRDVDAAIEEVFRQRHEFDAALDTGE